MPCAALATAAMQCVGARARGARTPDRRRGLGLAVAQLQETAALASTRHGKMSRRVIAKCIAACLPVPDVYGTPAGIRCGHYPPRDCACARAAGTIANPVAEAMAARGRSPFLVLS